MTCSVTASLGAHLSTAAIIMCYQLIEVYSECHCLYYQHSVDRCADWPNHTATKRVIYVGYSCSNHSKPVPQESPVYEPGYSHSEYARNRRPKTSTPRLRKKPCHDNGNIAQVTSASIDTCLEQTADSNLKTQDGDPQSEYKGDEAKSVQEWSRSDWNNLLRRTETKTRAEISYGGIRAAGEGPSLDPEKFGNEYTESLISDAETVVSVAWSTASTLVDGDASTALFKRLLLFEDLRHLWPQLVHRYSSPSAGVQTIERFLRRYAEDLDKLASSRPKNDPDGRICLAAARFVRKSRLNIACRIWEAHWEACGGNSEDANNEKDKRRSDEPEDIVRNKRDTNDDFDINFAVCEQFLFATSPILALSSSVEAFVPFRNAPEENVPAKISRLLELGFMKIPLTSMLEPSLTPGKQRVRCTCVSLCFEPVLDYKLSAASRQRHALNFSMLGLEVRAQVIRRLHRASARGCS